MTRDSHTALVSALQVAVPIAMAEIARLDHAERQRLTDDATEDITAHGDELLYGGEHCRPVFANLARALAAAAFHPGGVTFAGAHWCLRGHQECPTPGAARFHARLCGMECTSDEDLDDPGKTDP